MKNTAIAGVAHELTLMFLDDNEIPSRFKKSSKKSKVDKTSKIEENYQSHLHSWTEAINYLLQNSQDVEQAWRFIRVNPKLDNRNINSVTLCQDFIDFSNLIIKRRDIDKCNTDEMGKLIVLSVAFQKEIEKQIAT